MNPLSRFYYHLYTTDFNEDIFSSFWKQYNFTDCIFDTTSGKIISTWMGKNMIAVEKMYFIVSMTLKLSTSDFSSYILLHL